MNGFICMKPLTLSAKDFFPGDTIPAESVLASRVLALKRSGYIAEAGDKEDDTKASKLPQNSDYDNYPIEIPISTTEGILTATVGSKSVHTAFLILQLSEKDAKAEISHLTDDDALMLINAVEKRKNVLTSVKERHEYLESEGGGPNGENV